MSDSLQLYLSPTAYPDQHDVPLLRAMPTNADRSGNRQASHRSDRNLFIALFIIVTVLMFILLTGL